MTEIKHEAGSLNLLLYLEQQILTGKNISNYMAREMLTEFSRLKREADPRHFIIIKGMENQLRESLKNETTRAVVAESERDDAHQEICRAKTFSPVTSEEYAATRGWSYLYQEDK